MKRQLKSFVESIAPEVWIERSANVSEVAALIHKLRPKGCNRRLRRFGPATDGGYIMPDDVDGVGGCISPGVSTECRFDLEIAKRGIDVYMADASVDKPPLANPRFHFIKKFLDVYASGTTVTLDDFCRSTPAYQSGSDLILQMDIEGAEYRVLMGASDELLKRFRIMVIEFHHLDQLFSAFSFGLIKSVLERLVRHHYVVHAHPNNFARSTRRNGLDIPAVMEFTFYRKDRAAFDEGLDLKFPHPLDAANDPCKADAPLPLCWRPRRPALIPQDLVA